MDDQVDDQVEPVASARAPSPDDGTGAVLYGMFTSFTEALGDLEKRLAAIEASVDGVRLLLQRHMDETAQSLGRRASDAGRRLAGDLGLRGRPKPPPGA